jgi:tetratricopeptide (TPR) repeat protein
MMILLASALLSFAAAQNITPVPEPLPEPVVIAPQVEFQTPQERLTARLDALAMADEAQARPLVDEIFALWSHSGSDTISLLMDRGHAAEAAGETDVAARMYDHVTALAPDFAEGWLAAGRIAAQLEDWTYAFQTLNTALTLEPRRFDAYVTLGRVLENAEAINAALDAYEEALAIHPTYAPALDAKARIDAARAGRAL